MQVKERALKDETFWFASSTIEYMENSPVEGEKGIPMHSYIHIYIVSLG